MAVGSEFLAAFLLVLARVSGVIALAPLPGARLFPPTAKIVLAVALAVLLAPFAAMPAGLTGAGVLTLAIAAGKEAGFGVAVGAALQLVTEMLGLAAQMLGFQAGYSYINTIDPSTQVDASILNVLLTVFGGLLFFTFDLHLHVIRALALSLTSTPLGTFAAEPAAALRIVRLGASVFETAVRLALPIVALLLLLDLALTFLSYVNGRMQLLTLSFTVKILFALAGLWAILPLAPRLFGEVGRQALEVVYALARP